MDRRSKAVLSLVVVMVMALLLPAGALAAKPDNPGGGGGGGKPTPPAEAGNNLSYPVIWAEGVEKTLPGTDDMTPVLNGTWWYQWGTNGTDPNITPASCLPDPDEGDPVLNPTALPLCDDGIPGQVDLINHVAGVPVADNPLPLVRAYLQKDKNNTWRAWNGTAIEAGVATAEEPAVDVDWIDWGDNLESVDWYTRSQVRTEVVLFQDNPAAETDPWLEYEMRHTSGWGIDEVHGLAADLDGIPQLGEGNRATVYSHCARLTIQKLLVDRDDARLADLIWEPGDGWTEPPEYLDDLVNPHIFNGSVHEGGDGPGYYSAEINVKGRIIYGYTWNVKTLNDATVNDGTAAGYYRLTFSFDQVCGETTLNTYFTEGVTEIMVPLEEETEELIAAAAAEAEPDAAGAVGVLDTEKNLTYIDVNILDRSGGGGKTK